MPKGSKLEVEEGITLLCSESLSVSARARVVSTEGRRYELEVLEFLGAGREKLVGHISSLRKSAHLNIVATKDVESAETRAGWHRWRLPHDALPELDADAVDLTTTFLGKPLSAPFLMAGMTGGSERAGTVNRRLATVCQELGLGMGLGSQRAMVERPDLLPTFVVRDVAPDILLIGNIGAVQLNYGVTIDDVKRLVADVQADAMAVHLNVLQEMVQPEGDRDWSGLLGKVEALIAGLDVPVIIKETGCGISAGTAVQLRNLGAHAIDVGGTGGTSWGWIEGFRAADPQRQEMGATFRDWGIPTAESLVSVRNAVGPDFPLMSTGGVRSGLDVAKAVALGADVAGMALPFFRAADVSVDEALALGRRITEEVRIAMVCSGCEDVSALGMVEAQEVR
ncbi:MAG: type 2 isopentenyl-diphosphate Delta-isomerase [Deltaproteobacteria bacterium]|nr:type 2 isopentenyl-diphosphate Delta-isomerase [Deltaproteobacteria bacterium]